MMGLLSGLQGAASAVASGHRQGSRRSSVGADLNNRPPPPGEEDETSVLDEEQGSIIMSMISQLRLVLVSIVRYPALTTQSPMACAIIQNWDGPLKGLFSNFCIGAAVYAGTNHGFHEPSRARIRVTKLSSIEYISQKTNANCLLSAEEDPNPEERFLKVLQYYLSGWHIKPKGVKKPYNPVLGEFFRCHYDYPNGTQGFYIAEQGNLVFMVSFMLRAHCAPSRGMLSIPPPTHSYFYISPANKLRICGELRPKSKFLGNSVATVMEGENRVFLMGKPEDGEYVISMPNMYARGILFGSLILELGDLCTAKCEATGMVSDVDFKTKGFFSGTYNAISGKIKRDGVEVGTLEGRWSHQLQYTPTKTGEKRTVFDAATESKNVTSKTVAPEEEQELNESRRLWSKLTAAIAAKDMEAATTAKCAVEDAQREAARKRIQANGKHVTRFFEQRSDGLWVPKILNKLPADAPADEIVKIVKEWIWAPRPATPSLTVATDTSASSSYASPTKESTTSSSPVQHRVGSSFTL
ncbi:hypothetical protein FRC03_005765 [Tulasnella sp. 419]|nr:hypothetical protein FRC03_005765 [Tulasnella sp. 419]